MTKKHYIQIARVIRENTRGADQFNGYEGNINVTTLIHGLAECFRQDNPRFDADRFYNACIQT
jgi:hypothetical protein